jgi:hypothetical protein
VIYILSVRQLIITNRLEEFMFKRSKSTKKLLALRKLVITHISKFIDSQTIEEASFSFQYQVGYRYSEGVFGWYKE